MQIEIKPLTPSLIGGYLSFFDDTAFSDNPDWSGCYCCFFHFPQAEWEAQTAAQNRDAAARFIRQGSLRGFLAYHNGAPVGWCSAGRKSQYRRLAGSLAEPGEDADSICAVTCFTIAPGYRNQGIATQLLQAVCESAPKTGFLLIEAYPSVSAQTSAHHYHGPLSLYRKFGFTTHRQQGDTLILRKQL